MKNINIFIFTVLFAAMVLLVGCGTRKLVEEKKITLRSDQIDRRQDSLLLDRENLKQIEKEIRNEKNTDTKTIVVAERFTPGGTLSERVTTRTEQVQREQKDEKTGSHELDYKHVYKKETREKHSTDDRSGETNRETQRKETTLPRQIGWLLAGAALLLGVCVVIRFKKRP